MYLFKINNQIYHDTTCEKGYARRLGQTVNPHSENTSERGHAGRLGQTVHPSFERGHARILIVALFSKEDTVDGWGKM